jgi:hypothetical protein
MPNIVRRREPANARAAITCESARVAAIEHRDEITSIRKLRVELGELIVHDRMRRRPIEIIGHKALVDVVRLVFSIVARNLCAMSGIEQHADVVVAYAVEQPVQALDDSLRRGPLVEHDADLLRLEAALLQHRAHEEHVVDAALEPVRRIRIVVDADQQRTATGLGRHLGHAAHSAGEGARLRCCHGVVPHGGDRTGVRQVPGGVVVQDVIGNIERLDDLAEAVGCDIEWAGQHSVVGIEQMEPPADLERLDTARKHIAHRWMADLRSEADKNLARDLLGIAHERVVADQRPEAVRQHHVIGARAQLLEHTIAQALLQLIVRGPLRHHARGPSDDPGYVLDAARAAHQVADPMEDRAGQQLRQRHFIGRRIDGHLVEQFVVFEKIDPRVQARIVGAQGPCDRLGPRWLEFGIDLGMADPVHTKQRELLAHATPAVGLGYRNLYTFREKLQA